MKKALILFFFVMSICSLRGISQSWQPVSTGCGTNDQNQWVNALTVYGNRLIAGGKFTSAGGTSASNIAAWDGSSWSPLGAGIGAASGFQVVRALAVFQGNLYAAGTFSAAGGSSAASIAKWDGTSWSAVGDGIPGDVRALTVMGGYLYAGGYFDDTIAGDTIHGIERWDGNRWSYLPGMRGYDSLGYSWDINGAIDVMYPKNGRLYLGGTYIGRTSIGFVFFGADNLNFWDTAGYLLSVSDTVFGSGVTYGGGSNYAAVRGIAEFQGKMYFSGKFDSVGHMPADDIAAYDGTLFSQVPNPAGGQNEMSSPLVPYQGGLLCETLSGSGKGVASYDGTSWTNLGGAFLGSAPYLGAFCEYNGDLYVAGEFTQAGSASAMNIAKWSGASGIPETSKDAFEVFPNPSTESVVVKGAVPYEEITVSDILGITVASGKADGYGSTLLNISQLSKGIYLVNGHKLVKD